MVCGADFNSTMVRLNPLGASNVDGIVSISIPLWLD